MNCGILCAGTAATAGILVAGLISFRQVWLGVNEGTELHVASGAFWVDNHIG